MKLYFCQQKHAARNRSVLLVGFGLLSLFGSNRAELSGAGALGVLTLGAVAGYGWRDDGKVCFYVQILRATTRCLNRLSFSIYPFESLTIRNKTD